MPTGLQWSIDISSLDTLRNPYSDLQNVTSITIPYDTNIDGFSATGRILIENYQEEINRLSSEALETMGYRDA